MTVVVTGAAGHLGGNLVRALLGEGASVRVLVHERERALVGLDVERVRGDVRDPGALRQAFAGAELVYHLAAIISVTGERGGLVSAVNVDGARNAAEAALACGVRRFVHCSSIHAYEQEPVDRPLDETRPWVADRSRAPAYDRSKAAGARAVLGVVERGLDAVLVHPTAVLGPHDYEPSRMGRVFRKLCRREFRLLVAGGFDWVDARDVVAGILAAGRVGRRGESYLLPGHWCSIRDLARLVSGCAGVPAPRLAAPMWLARVGAPFVAGWGRLRGAEPLYTGESLRALRANRHISAAKAERELGYSSRPLAETLRAVHDWFLSTGRL